MALLIIRMSLSCVTAGLTHPDNKNKTICMKLILNILNILRIQHLEHISAFAIKWNKIWNSDQMGCLPRNPAPTSSQIRGKNRVLKTNSM